MILFEENKKYKHKVILLKIKKKIDQNKNKESSIVSSKDSFEMEKKIDDLQTENEQLKKKIEESTVNTNLKESSKITELQTGLLLYPQCHSQTVELLVHPQKIYLTSFFMQCSLKTGKMRIHALL